MEAEQGVTSQAPEPSGSSGNSKPYHPKRNWKNSSGAGPSEQNLRERRRDVRDQREKPAREGEKSGNQDILPEQSLAPTKHGKTYSGGNQHDKKTAPSGSSSRAETPVQSADDKNQARPAKLKAGYRARAPNFNPGLTVAPDSKGQETASSAHGPSSSQPTGSAHHEYPKDKQRRKPRPGQKQAHADDLTSTLIQSLSRRPYPDCPICFSGVLPNQPTWSCSPSTPQVISPSEDGSAPVPQYCWTTFHLKCIRSWAEKSVKSLEEAWRNRGEMDKKGEWRCPGCQAKREMVPTSYWCFCHSTPDPKPPRLATPHSCGSSCTRPRATGCGHPCPLLCHPGPCPPCQVVIQMPCPCPRKKVVMFRCGDDAMPGKGKARDDITARDKAVSCGNVCGRMLNCGKHSCERLCHPGACGGCELIEEVKCYCGRTSKQLGCGDGEAITCSIRNGDGMEETWIGRFECEHICDRPFDCSIHRCQKICHAPSSEPPPCPFNPNNVTHCPCGKFVIASSDNSPASSEGRFTFPPRQGCTDPIPTCDSTCSKIHPLCGHECTAKCHLGPCPPCSVPTIRPCRCGLTTREIKCTEFITEEGGEKEVLCDRPCTVLRACGKHECRRLCCPLASLAVGKTKKGRGAGVDVLQTTGIGEEEGGLHECDLPCGKPLACGNHTCERKDHKGPCPSCLRSTFEEITCACGRTVLDPPVPCGTKVDCRFQCQRQTSCGHPPMSHTCHDELLACPPCAYLTTKWCACGKKEILNTKCSLEQEKVSCASVCERLLSCGFHRCQRLCHIGDCGTCTAPCGKDRKLCLPAHHPCTRPCHAPSTCPEAESCEALVAVSCPCGRLRQSIRCGRNSLSIGPSESAELSSPSLKCNNQCEIAKRNARLAEALGINEDARERTTKHMAVVYPDEVVAFAKEDSKFVLLVEKTFAEFIASGKRAQVLPHMPQERRKFVYSVASIYRLDAQMVDQEPLRSVQVVRRLDSRVPTPLLSSFVASTVPPPPNLGKLGLSANLNQNSAWRVSSSKSASPAPPAPAASVQVIPPVPVLSMTASGARGWGLATIGNPRVSSNTTATTSAPAVAGVPVSSSIITATTTAALNGRRGPVPLRSSMLPHVASGAESSAAVAEPDGSVPDSWEDDT